MSVHDPRNRAPDVSKPADPRHGGHRGGHGWMMIACCVPMIKIAIVLVATGVASIGFVFVAIACTAATPTPTGRRRPSASGPFTRSRG
ncbi:hypothetical protein [Actinacidiphila glaucinigra]|uniref:hypothetical protein n=1 Tax=Actinacidiphila glaucinigra TaxID=235986 RepID=UPI0036EE752A